MIRAVAVELALLAVPVLADPVTPLSARFAQPTDRYPHSVLDDLCGSGALEVTLAGGTTPRLMRPEARVPEDIAPCRDVELSGLSGAAALPGPLPAAGFVERLVLDFFDTLRRSRP